jgi:hypothetical protein
MLTLPVVGIRIGVIAYRRIVKTVEKDAHTIIQALRIGAPHFGQFTE